MTELMAPLTRLIKVCRRRGRSQEEAEDLIQEAFLRLHEYCRNAEVINKEAFLTRTVANLAINEYRREQIISYAIESLDELEQSALLIDSNPGPERFVLAQQHLEKVTDALGAVSVRTCEIFLAQRAGYSYDEIASDLGITQRTVQKHVARAVCLLTTLSRKDLEWYCP